ncbi:hypothetical protein ZTR_09741 [Talaromyces verruculosus]|nr:hypothetical protein ZTR_09741 [Talaromyces verruculosus]
MAAGFLAPIVLQNRHVFESIAEFLRILAGICWTLNYFSMLYTSWRHKLPSTGIFPICCDIAWEYVYAFVHPSASAHWQGGVRVWFLVHCIVIIFITRYAPNEWTNMPFMQRYIWLIYGAVILGFAAGQLAFAAEVGPALGFFYGGVLCQTLASLGPICQILTRNSTRGASLLTWMLRAIATFGGFIKLSIYYFIGRDEGPWFESPMCKFYIGLTLMLDFTYPFCYHFIRLQESARSTEKAKKSK